MGKAKNLRIRVATYFKNKKDLGEKTQLLVSKISKIDYQVVESELEALLLEAHLIKTHQPFFNTRAKDDKHPIYIKITINDDFPRVFTARRGDELGSLFFGPFPSSQTVKQVLRFLRRVFPFDTQKTIAKRPCFWSHLGLCNPCPSNIKRLSPSLAKIEKAKYRKNIRHLASVLSRKTGSVREKLTGDMAKFAKSENYEQAATIRDQIEKLDYITRPYLPISSYLENPSIISDIRAGESKSLYNIFKKYLHLKTVPKRVECFDASHTALTNPAVGMVTFINGEPERNFYRRFKIKQRGMDDLAFLEEALIRRFSHQEWGLPDLLVIDGGKTQVGKAKKVIKRLRLSLPIIGLAKPFDNVIVPRRQGFLILRLKDEPALKLLQRLRDEAHRFARAYHIKLRSKKFFDDKQ